jgi:putative transposase
VVWIPKYRKKKLYGDIAKYLGETFHELARQRESRIIEGHIWDGSKTSPERTSGRKDIMYQRWAGMKRVSRSIFGSRKQRTNGWISWNCSRITKHQPPLGGS